MMLLIEIMMEKQMIIMVLVVLIAGVIPHVLAFDTYINNTNIFVNDFLGVGTNAPNQTLYVNGTFVVYNISGTLGLFQSASGKVGIGTTDTDSKFSIEMGSSSEGKALGIRENTEDNFYIYADFAGTGTTGNWIEMRDWSNHSIMSWRGDGHVGVGTTSPSQTLSVNGTFAVRNATGTLGLFQNESGRVGIGTATPQDVLHLSGGFIIANAGYSQTVTGRPTFVTSTDDAFFLTGVTSGSNTDYRIYVEDDPSDSFSIYGNSCGGSGCNNLSGSQHIATFMSNQNNTLNVSGFIHSGCPSGWWSAAYGRVCMESTERTSANMHNAFDTCNNQQNGARVCKESDYVQICGTGQDPFTASKGWFGDKVTASSGNGDDEYGTWNRNDCSSMNMDGPAEAATNTNPYHCCI